MEAAGPLVPAFVPFVAETALPPPPDSGPTGAAPSAPIEVELARAMVRVATGADGALLAAVLRAVRASATPA